MKIGLSELRQIIKEELSSKDVEKKALVVLDKMIQYYEIQNSFTEEDFNSLADLYEVDFVDPNGRLRGILDASLNTMRDKLKNTNGKFLDKLKTLSSYLSSKS